MSKREPGQAVALFSDTPGMRTGYALSYNGQVEVWKLHILNLYLQRFVQREEPPRAVRVPVVSDDGHPRRGGGKL